MLLRRFIPVPEFAARTVLVVAALVGSADPASRAAFTERPLKGRIEGLPRRTPHRLLVDEKASVERVRSIRNRQS
ncbi:hypothetical protein [Microvirga subterranea]|uniref:Uncharacterized protein n=1 Tax=Microvirga subterranea TaxID=186651 RepID=A0A370HG22_9HYPH|nr:hypothetical protein [Microvirga subterranea]RDI56322.1 hypothetical protein DES45_1096 [Microvirga subterranea]